MLANVEPNTIGRHAGIENCDLSDHNARQSQPIRSIFVLVQIVQNHCSLPSVETQAEPSGALNNRRTNHGPQQTYKIIAKQPFLQRNQHSL